MALHFVRHVPIEFADFDKTRHRQALDQSKVCEDRTERRAIRVARKLNEELEAFWRAVAFGPADTGSARYDEARRFARALGFDYVENEVLVAAPLGKQLARLKALIDKGLAFDRAALLGNERRRLSCCRGFSKSTKLSSAMK